MVPPTGAVQAVAGAAREMARTGGKSPRFTVGALAGVLALAVVLAFILALIKLPRVDAISQPVQTTGDWMTRNDFRDELDARDKRLSPATNEALSEIRTALNALRTESAAAEKAREDRAKAVLDTLSRIDSRVEAQAGRIDRIYERVK